ncbi:MAG: peptidoglycan DD-metalloendopeptidase family protein [Gammaproteobacteria bacterium]|nr:peptidoglycan DD-metalloendopeptidase family protein [Gammaproteobacteria bacterium]
MTSVLLLKLAVFTLWTTVLVPLVMFVQRRTPALQQWPALHWWLLLLSTVPLWPQWQWPVAIQLPTTFWLDATQHIGQFTAIGPEPVLTTLLTYDALFQILLFVIVIGACWHLLRLARQYRQIYCLYQQAKPVAWSELFANDQPLPVLKVLNFNLQIRQHGLALSPFIFGGRQPVLMLPAYFWHFSNRQRALLLAHELQHWQRRDPWQLFCWRVIVAVGWFNPALRYFERAFCRAMEVTVDRLVLTAQPEQALLYGQTLISSLKLCQQQANPGVASFIQVAGDDAGYRQRLAALFQANTPSIRLQRWLPPSVLGLAMLINVGCSILQGQTAQPGKWQLPVAVAKVNSGFGSVSAVRNHRPHQGIDFAGSTGDPVLASEDGVVVVADSYSLNIRLGNTVLLDHGHGYQTLYAHLDRFLVQPGTKVRAGQQIGAVGATGVATGPHLHFELLHQGQQLDPTSKLQWSR